MHIVEVNRGVRRPFYSSFLPTVIFILCISVCVIFVTTNYKEDTKFNTKYDEEKWSYPKGDDITERITFTNNLPPKKNLQTNFPTHFSIYVIFGYICLAIVFLVIICIIYRYCRKLLRRFNPIRSVRYEPVVHFDGEGADMDYNNDPIIVQPDRVEPVVPIDNDEVRWWNIFGAAEAG